MYYLPPVKPHWRLGYLWTPASWPGGMRRIKVQVNYACTRFIEGHSYVQVRVTSRTDEHYAAGSLCFMPEKLISGRE